MKKNIFIVVFLCMIIALGVSSISIAAGSFTTGGVTSEGATGAASANAWAYTPTHTGTRYVFRIYNDSIDKYEELDSAYYVNHVTQGKGEEVFLGNGVNMVKYAFKNDYSRSSYFDTVASSSKDTGKYGNGKYRHVINWRTDNGTNYYDNFGLSDADIKVLADTVIRFAKEKGDTATADKMEKVKSNEVLYDVRAEILMKYRIQGKKNDKVKSNGENNPFGIRVTYKNGYHAFLTYNELRAIWWDYPDNVDDTRRFFDVVAMQLYEEDDRYLYRIVNGKSELNCSCNYATKEGYQFSIVKGANTSTAKDKYKLYLKMNKPFGDALKAVVNKNKSGSEKYADFARRYLPGFCAIHAKYNEDDYYPVLGVVYNKNWSIQYYLSDSKQSSSTNSFCYNYANKYYENNWESYLDIHEKNGDLLIPPTKPIISEGWDYIYNSLDYVTSVKINFKTTSGKDIINPTSKNISKSESINRTTYENLNRNAFSSYTYKGVQEISPNKGNIQQGVNSVTINHDKKIHEITFWYDEPIIQTQVKIEYRDYDDGTLMPGIQSNNSLFSGHNFNISYTDPSYFGNNPKYEYVSVSTDGKEENKKSVTISDDGGSHIVIFWYRKILKVEIKIVLVINENVKGGSQFTKELPFNYTCNAEDVFRSVMGVTYDKNKYDYLGYFSKENEGLTYLGDAPNNSTNKYTKELDKSTVTLLLVFHYKTKQVLNVTHQVEQFDGGTRIIRNDSNLSLPQIVKSQIGYELKNVVLDGDNLGKINEVTVKEDLTKGETRTLVFTYNENQYIKEIHRVKKLDGTTEDFYIKDNQKLPGTFFKRNVEDYELIDVKLDNISKGTAESIKVSVDPSKGAGNKRTIIFDYEEQTRLPVITSLEIIPSDVNNQMINSHLYNSEIKKWVLDEKAELEIRLVVEGEISLLEPTDVNIQFPFDVYIEGKLKKANENVKITLNGVSGTLKNIFIPIWAKEGEGTINANITSIGMSASKIIRVIGSIYDFSITNLLADSANIWKTSLFIQNVPTNGEYEAPNLPIGQQTQQNEKFMSGIPLGSKIYFSVNTKGTISNSIKIIPEFYYASKEGNLKQVDVYSNGQKLSDVSTSRSAKGSDSYRAIPLEELITAKTLYPKVDYTLARNIGNYTKMNIPSTLRTPDIAYTGNSNGGKIIGGQLIDGKTLLQARGDSLYKYVSHWYADYMVPANVQLIEKGKTYSMEEANKYKNGFLVVYFKIYTVDNSGSDYLSYNKSVGETTGTKTMWMFERGTTDNRYQLPKVNVSVDGKEIDGWLKNPINENGSATVIIYDLSKTTSQNYDTVGTH